MLVIEFFKWWYVQGWKDRFNGIYAGVQNIASALSVKILFRTMFKPWKQIVTQSFADTALDDRMRALFDNVVSRTIGFFVRLLTLFVAALAIILNLVYKIILLLVWPFIPLLPIVLLIASLAELVS